MPKTVALGQRWVVVGREPAKVACPKGDTDKNPVARDLIGELAQNSFSSSAHGSIEVTCVVSDGLVTLGLLGATKRL